MIRTIIGDIQDKELGMTLCHEHFIIDLDRIRKDGISVIETVEEVIPEIEITMKQGIESVIEVTTIDLRRDIKKLVEISQKTGIKIIASTGFYLSEFHPFELNDMSAQEIADIYVKDLTAGIDGTGYKAGIIAEIASSGEGFVGHERKILEAAALASKQTGAAVSTHTNPNTVFETIDILLRNGVIPDKVIIGHQDLIDDPNYHIEILKRGVNIAFDTCGKTSYMSDEIRAKNALNIIKNGYGDQLLLSNDVSRRSYFTSAGGMGYTAVLDKVVPLLREYGATEEDVRKLLVLNPARILNNDWK